MAKMTENVHEKYKHVGGQYFTVDSGKHVPLDDRPEELVQGVVEQAFRGRDGIYDVTNTAGLVLIYCSGWEADDLKAVIEENTDFTARFKKKINNRRKANIPKEADHVFIFETV